MKTKLIPIGIIAMCFAIYFIILFPYDYLYFTLLPTGKIFRASNTIVANIFLEIVLVVLYVFLVSKIKKTSLLSFKKAGISAKSCVAALFVGAFSGLYTVCFFKLPYTLDHFPTYNKILESFFGQGVFIAFALFCITSSVFKEVLFRGIVMNEMKSIMPVAAAIILQAAIYGAANFYSQGIEAVVFAALGAVVFGLIYFWSKNIFISMIAQLGDIIVIITLTMLKDNVINRTTSSYVLAPSIIGMVALGFYFYHLYRKSTKAAKAVEPVEATKEVEVAVNTSSN